MSGRANTKSELGRRPAAAGILHGTGAGIKNQIIFGANHFVSLIPAADSSCWICWDKGFSSEVSFASFELAWTSFDRPSKRVALSSAQAGRIHPTQKPVALYAWIFNTTQSPGTGSWTHTWGAGQAGSPRGTPAWTSQGTRSTRSISRPRKSGSSNTPRKCPCSAGGVSDHNIHF